MRPKEKGVLDDIAVFIKMFYPKKSGLIYCTSRKDCETVSNYINEKHHIKTGFYHADMNDSEKDRI